MISISILLVIISITFLILLFLGLPIFLAITTVAMIGIVFGTHLSLFVISKTFVDGINNFVLLAIPGYILAGKLMNAGGIAEKLSNFAGTIVGHFRGGLAHVNVLTSMIMAGISGIAISDAATTSTVLIPVMVKNGYPKSFSAAITAASSTIGPIIPPSGMFVLFGAITGVSIGRLFVAGFIPGVFMGMLQMFACSIIAKNRNFPFGEKASFKKILRVTKDSFFSILVVFIIIGGLVFGIFTPTEGSFIAVFLCVILASLVYRKLKLTDFPQILKDTAVTTGTVLIIVGSAKALGWVIGYFKVSELLTNWITSISQNTIVILLFINLVVLFLGCLMDIVALMVILTPMLMPLIYSLGVDPVHFGVVFVLNLMIGLITPPVGLVMYITCGIADVKIKEYIKEIWPFWIALIILLIIITLVPEITLWLPSIIF